MLSRDRPLRKDAIRLAVARDDRHRTVNRLAGPRPRRGVESLKQKVCLAVAGKAGKADHFALAHNKMPGLRLAAGLEAEAHPRFAPPARRLRGLDRGRLALDPAHRSDELSPIEVLRQVGGDDLAVAHHDDAVTGLQDLAENVGDEHAAHA